MMPEGWKTYKLEEVATIIGGGTPSTANENNWNGNIPWLTPRDLTNYNFRFISRGERSITEDGLKDSSAKLLPKGTVLLTSRAPIGYLAIAKNPICTNQGFKSLIPQGNKTDTNFLYYLLKNNTEYIKSLGVGTTFAEISGNILKNIEFQFPASVDEQSRIASILSSLDDKIELNLQMNKTLEAIAQTIFKEWFVDFRFPGFDGELVGGLPKGWKKGTLGKEFRVIMGQSPPGESYNETGEGSTFFQGRTDFGYRFPENRMYTTSPSRMASKYDTLISVRAPVGDINMALENCCIGRGLSSVRHTSGAYSYTYYAMKSLSGVFKGFDGEGTIFGSINKTNFENIDMLVPETRVINEFEIKINTIDEKILNNSLEIKTLTQLRDLLLPKLMIGKIRVA